MFFLMLIFIYNFQCSLLYVVKPCQIILPCTEKEDIVFATEGEECHTFQNQCKLRNENCERHNVFFKTLVPINHAECIRMCRKLCSDIGVAFCGRRSRELVSFTDFCDWKYRMCTDRKYYIKLHPGICTKRDEKEAAEEFG